MFTILFVRYIPEIEKQIAILSSQVSEIIEYRKGRANFLKRTFVSASDASRSKCLKTDLDIPKDNLHNKQGSNTQVASINSKDFYNNFDRQSDMDIPQNLPVKSGIYPPANSIAAHNLLKLSDADFNLLEKVKCQDSVRKKIVLFIPTMTSYYNVVSQSAAKAQLKLSLKQTGTMNLNKRYLKTKTKVKYFINVIFLKRIRYNN